MVITTTSDSHTTNTSNTPLAVSPPLPLEKRLDFLVSPGNVDDASDTTRLGEITRTTVVGDSHEPYSRDPLASPPLTRNPKRPTRRHEVCYALLGQPEKEDERQYLTTGGRYLRSRVELWKESDKIEKYVGGLPDMIHGSVMASKPKTMQDAIEFATELMDKKIRTFAERQSENKRKQDDNQQQQQNKRQNTSRAYAAGSGEKKPYRGSKPLCSKCNYHHDGQCAPKCHKCNRVGHLAHDCRSTANANTANNQRGTRAGRIGTNPDSNVVTSTFLLNTRYASILFDTSADRSFVSTAFSSQIDITPSTLDHYYDVELADGRIIGLNAIIRGCTLNFLNYPFNIDIMPVQLGSLDVIIGMDWLAKYQAVIVHAEKIVRIP
ncbi:reverse transcriptase domain-containing protein [Tanacetum coccineum]|uniref:Reverse transcriptase domain-containing protein n=1 Tax=Tanacetum coccineum TaxID=301880 RepID=A0ABQ5ELG6_9ASTR